MPTYKKTNITAKNGINYIRTIVEGSGCLFHKIEQENDLGIDALIEFVRNEKPTHRSLAIQVKSGKSYYITRTNECVIPVDSHAEYWCNYALDVFGIVYVPELDNAYWVDIKAYLKHNSDVTNIRFSANRSNQIDAENFSNVFVPRILKETPNLTLEEAISLFDSDHCDEFMLGAFILFRRYVNSQITWEKFFNHLENANSEDVNYNIVRFLSHIPWHSDIFHFGEMINPDIKRFGLTRISSFSKAIVIKLLQQIDEELGIQRGTIGQAVEAIVGHVNNINEYLQEIVLDKKIDILIRNHAATILAYYLDAKSLKTLEKISEEESLYIPELVKFINEYGWFNPYQ